MYRHVLNLPPPSTLFCFHSLVAVRGYLQWTMTVAFLSFQKVSCRYIRQRRGKQTQRGPRREASAWTRELESFLPANLCLHSAGALPGPSNVPRNTERGVSPCISLTLKALGWLESRHPVGFLRNVHLPSVKVLYWRCLFNMSGVQACGALKCWCASEGDSKGCKTGCE
jgi:hypothetical protein